MGKYILPALFLLFMALNAAIFAFITLELDGSTVTTKQSVTQQEIRRR